MGITDIIFWLFILFVVFLPFFLNAKLAREKGVSVKLVLIATVFLHYIITAILVFISPRKKQESSSFSEQNKEELSADDIPTDAELVIQYVDAQGVKTERAITPKRFDGEKYLYAYCHRAKDMRTFLIHRIQTLLDLKTGEVVKDIHSYFFKKPKVQSWQFVPYLNISTPSKVLAIAYKVFSREQYLQLKKEFPSHKDDWISLEDFEKEKPDEQLPFLKGFRNIIESKNTQEEKVNKINDLVATNKKTSCEYFDLEGLLKPGEQWFADKLHGYGLPMAHELYAEGYTTPVKCLKIDPEEFVKRKGVGPKRKQQLEAFQEKVRKAVNKKKTVAA
jgi:uncharacterized protein YhhL (DUF1145 family)